MAQDLDISNIQPKRDRIRIERKKYDELVAERNRLKAENMGLKELLSKNNSDKIELGMDLKEARQSIENWQNRVIAISNKTSHIRDQRDMARLIAALLLIVSLGFAVAVWMGKLIPVF